MLFFLASLTFNSDGADCVGVSWYRTRWKSFSAMSCSYFSEPSVGIMSVFVGENLYEGVLVLDNLEFLNAVLGFCTSGDPVLCGSVVILPGVGPALLAGWLIRDGI